MQTQTQSAHLKMLPHCMQNINQILQDFLASLFYISAAVLVIFSEGMKPVRLYTAVENHIINT